MSDSVNQNSKPLRESLVAQLSELIRQDIVSGVVKPGDRLPSEAELVRKHSVSRTVVREAISALRSDGLVEARRGSGVYALDHTLARQAASLAGLNSGRIAGVIEILEVRSAFEMRAASLAAERRSTAQIEKILAEHKKVSTLFREGAPTREADFQFHYAIAEASQNSLFPQILQLIRPGMVPRTELGKSTAGPAYAQNPALPEEHRRIVEAIMDQDPEAAEKAMADHLEGNLRRYRAVLRESMEV
ncbi:FadR/GntR family transcriptional regulator [Psychromarinibacter sp. C21-152]|uniref:FadR/GntR family transcriptional regulator n=1 Tax=Psychromarinibacter sediminicola TaxID=3033385 RepID=A0AAE3NVG4_9RHOB|nr:FadR/GntR family transcriptional regulator [Psychromarinibacter sediminicola]MDF0601710.1 FadR/GntR family transcriptional regulator [Psychromarinibacter sediminicola]